MKSKIFHDFLVPFIFTRKRPCSPAGTWKTGALLVFILIAVSSAPLQAAVGKGAVRVVATFLPLYIFTANVAGERAEVSLLVPPGTDVHGFALRPRDLKMLRGADLVVANGAGLDEHMLPSVNGGGRVLYTTSGMALIEGPDPHAWLDPLLAAVQVGRIRDALVLLDPEGAAYYNHNAEEYIKRLRMLDGEITGGLEQLRGRYLLTYHESFGYFAGRYGLRHSSLTGPHAERPLPRRTSRMYDIIRKEGVKAVFTEGQFPRGVFGRLASDLGVRVCRLNSLAAGEMKNDYYERAMRENMRSILGCIGGGD
jgi:zinc/manganese transport system substrate-binding protein